MFLVSDFQLAGSQVNALTETRRAMRLANRRHDLVALHIHDRNEVELPDVGTLSIEDAETGELIELDTANPQVRRRFAQLARERIEQLHQAFASEGVDYLDLDARESYVPALMAFFKNRERRMR
jgi:uncharacterized protein (DUF58 family)